MGIEEINNFSEAVTARFPCVEEDSVDTFHTILECQPQIAVVISIEKSDILYTNLGAPQASSGRQSIELMLAQLRLKHGQELERIIRSKGKVLAYEFQYDAMDGTTSWWVLSVSKMTYLGKPSHLMSFSDVSELKLAKEALAYREDQYRTLIKTAPSYVVGFSELGEIRFMSRGLGELLGFDPKSIIGSSIIEFVHPKDRKRVLDAVDRGSQGNEVSGFSFRCRNSEGGWLLLEASARDMRDDPIVSGFMVALRDGTERYHMSAKLQQNRMELRTIVDASLSSISLIDQQGFIRRANKTFEKKWNIPVREVIGRNARDFVPLEEFNVTMQAMVEARETRQKCHLIYQQNDHWYETYVSPVIEDDDVPNAFVIVTTDVTEKRNIENAIRESEARLRDIAEYATDWFWEADETLHYNYLSDTSDMSFEGVFSLQLGGHILDVFEGIEESSNKAELSEILKARQPFRNVNSVITASDKQIYVSLAGKPLFSKDGLFVGYRGTGKNITAEILAEQQAKEVEKRLFQSQKMEAVGQLTGGVAHDFNNLLAIICGNIELLKEQLDDNEALSALAANALSAVDRGSSLTQRLLAFSRKQLLLPKKVCLLDLVEGMKEIFARTLAGNIEVQTHSEGGLWPVKIDVAQMENSLLNLALNARDAMPAGGQLSIKLTNKRIVEKYLSENSEIQPGEYVSLRVIDTGAGIDKNAIPYIFDPFYSTKAVGKGTGLGLSMVFGFVGQSNGHISVQSSLNEGTCFELLFPKCESEHEDINDEEEIEPIDQVGNHRILLVEDDEDVRSVTCKHLINGNCSVLLAQNADEAMSIIERDPDIDLLLTDIVLPGGKNGLELAEEARVISPSLNVLCMSGYLGDSNFNDHIGDTDTHFIGKPYRSSELLELIDKIVSEDRMTTADTQK